MVVELHANNPSLSFGRDIPRFKTAFERWEEANLLSLSSMS